MIGSVVGCSVSSSFVFTLNLFYFISFFLFFFLFPSFSFQNDLVHGWGMDMKLGYCAQVWSCDIFLFIFCFKNQFFCWSLFWKWFYSIFQGDRTEKVGVVDSQYVLHMAIQTLGSSPRKVCVCVCIWSSIITLWLCYVGIDLIAFTGSCFLQASHSDDSTKVQTKPLLKLNKEHIHTDWFSMVLLIIVINNYWSFNRTQHGAAADKRAQVRKQSTWEQEAFEKRWEKAAKEDKNWVDPFRTTSRSRARTQTQRRNHH